VHNRLPIREHGYHGRVAVTQDVSCVTGACLLTRLDLYRALGGLDEEMLPVAYNDVDFCLKVRTQNLRVIFAANAKLYHMESVSRGLDTSTEKRARLERDRMTMLQRWGADLVHDPFYSPNLSLTATDCRLAWPTRACWPWTDVAGEM
jgi:O-antigen biosynthesis protein